MGISYLRGYPLGIYAAGSALLHFIFYTQHIFYYTAFRIQYSETIDVLFKQRPPVPDVSGYLTVTLQSLY